MVNRMAFGIGDIFLTTYKPLLQQWDLPTKTGICVCQVPKETMLKVLHSAKKENHNSKLCDIPTYMWLE